VKDVAGVYSSRGGLEPGSPVFVGRQDILRDIFMRLSGPGKNLPGVAIVGPHRIGKTSLLKQLLHPALRVRYVQDEWHVAYLNVSGRPWTGLDSFRESALSAFGVPQTHRSYYPTDCFTDAIRRVLRDNGGKTTVLILDEFNYIASQLGRDEQAELRSAIDDISSFTLVLGVSQNPDEILEHIPYDVASELAPVINLALPSLGRLYDDEARQLIGVGRYMQELEPDEKAAEWLIDLVGTHPLLLHAACFAWYRQMGTRSFGELSRSERNAVRTAINSEIDLQWRYVVRSLSGTVRALMYGQISSERAPKAQKELEDFGVKNWAQHISVGLLADLNSAPGSIGDEVDELMKEIETVSERHRLLVGRDQYLFRREQLIGNDLVYLRRKVNDRGDFKHFIEALGRLLYDGSNGVVPPELRGKVKPTLPGWCYSDSRSVILHVTVLRNYAIHLAAPDADLEAEHLQSAGEVFEIYCHNRSPEGSDWEAIRGALVNASTDFMRRLNRSLPLRDDLRAADFFDGSPSANE
jgi:hypothetical protein